MSKNDEEIPQALDSLVAMQSCQGQEADVAALCTQHEQQQSAAQLLRDMHEVLTPGPSTSMLSQETDWIAPEASPKAMIWPSGLGRLRS